MKIITMFNAIIILILLTIEPIIKWVAERADTYSLGAEMTLGLFCTFFYYLLVFFIMISVLCSVLQSVFQKHIKYFFPPMILIAGIIIYFVIYGNNAFLIRVLEQK